MGRQRPPCHSLVVGLAQVRCCSSPHDPCGVLVVDGGRAIPRLAAVSLLLSGGGGGGAVEPCTGKPSGDGGGFPQPVSVCDGAAVVEMLSSNGLRVVAL